MRSTALLVAVVAACLVLASGVALAVNRVGTNGPDVLKGTDGEDNLLGLGGQDDLFGKGGSDNLVGGPGKDNVLGGDERRPGGGDKNLAGGEGNDFLGPLQAPADRDLVACGAGFDRVLADRKDRIAQDCEKVFIGRDSQGAFFGSLPRGFFRELPPNPFR